MYGFVSEHVLYPLFDLINRRKVTGLHRQYMAHQWLSRQEIDRDHFASLIELITFAGEHVPYYRSLFAQQGIRPEELKTRTDLLRIPVLSKEIINERFESIISEKADRKKLTMSQSGGSTGEPIKFYLDTLTLDAHKAIGMRFYSYMGLSIGDRAVRLWGAPRAITTAKTLKGRLYERINNRLFLDGFDLSEETMASYVRRIRAFRPRLIMGYVQCIDLLAQYIEKHQIEGIRPKAVFTTSSVLYPEIRERITRVLGCPVYNEYGSCEIGAVAHECDRHDGMHIDTELCFIEFIKDGRLAEPGEEAELIVTTLCNPSMPLIRYRIGDIGSYSERVCSCGRGLPLIEHITGRTFGVFTALDGSKVHGYYFTNRVFMKLDHVKQFQMIQKSLKEYTLRLVRNPGWNDQDKSFIEQMLREKLGTGIMIDYEYPEKIDPEGSGKYLYTKSYVKEGY